MSEIFEWDQINEKVHYGAVRDLKETEQSQNVKSKNWIVNWMILRFQKFLFERVKQTLTENLVDISFMFFKKMNRKSQFHTV